MSFVRFCAHGQDGERERVWEVAEEEGEWSKAARAWTAGGGLREQVVSTAVWTVGFHVVQASTLEDGGLTADDQSDLHDFTKRALKKKPHLPRVHEPAGQQTL